MSAFLSKISIAVPPYKTDQADLASFMSQALPLTEQQSHLLKVIYRASGIQSRYSVLEDFQTGHSTRFQTGKPFPSVEERMALYKKHALPLAKQALQGLFDLCAPERISHLIVISCTGMYAPGLDIELIRSCGLSSSTERTSIQYMGCYAAFNGIKVAKNIVRSEPTARVAMVCVELCSLHLQQDVHEDALLSNALFGDGAAATLISSEPLGNTALSLENQYNDLYFEGIEEMSWNIGNQGFEMKLSGKVPNVIRSGITELTETLLSKLKLGLEEISFFAVHPGGKKILEVIKNELSLNSEDLKNSMDILRNYGNMSSGTVLFVIHQLWQKFSHEDHGKFLLSFAFGPGLTMESLLLKVHVD